MSTDDQQQVGQSEEHVDEIGLEGVDCLRKDLSEGFLIARRPA